MKESEISNYGMLKIALKGETAFTLRHWFEVQFLRIKMSYLDSLNYISGRASYKYQWRDVHLTPRNRNLYIP